MCQIVRREGTASFGGDTCIGSEDVARKREEGSKYPPPPSGTRFKKNGDIFEDFSKIPWDFSRYFISFSWW